ncbi:MULTISPECIES: DEAD/DEAH box helicase [Cryobacterium]|uniref:DEAD/DEAH box helicase n=1 Tax=Cryobacterium glucosi TaxID=1259175 RepID=A0ABY2IJ92_9MICO|nr:MULTISPECIES: DEAD/DEAH box helicase [Cryobacterium]TFC01357.1 DEAD/DEAH box helicase [Cryobacterium sp. MDB2-A-1]TFC08821.1 DEAD/DEAH box helicase [Cryobacterium sp. MDB2-33-2]TFC09176.1 DEAD/DEAH box helicase [Cryobacterium sp. MDB2-A-2]TFC18017.1 DEAD/DEAH box helicase [Cryobacterium glucosi]TFC22873.1 DEAD/DEAH box helicase [Cryobacterium sp. MDB1-18-2]
MSETSFGALGVPAPLVAVLTAQGIDSPFPIQVDTLPDTLKGRDVLGRGKTGSGKTLAFAIPMAARLGGKLAGGKRRPGRPLGLILAPTRELATQITTALTPFAEAYGLNTTTIFGGVSQGRQVSALKAGVDIVVACPGRLEDLMKQGYVNLDSVEITVLDEADHMADLGFLPVVTRILDKTPNGGQRLLFSATLDNGVDKIVRKFLHNEVLHSVDDSNSIVSAMTHHVFEIDNAEQKKALIEKLASGTGRRILFMRTKHHAKKLAKALTEAGIPSVDLHGNLSQVARDRNLAAFSNGDVSVLVATDVAARGVHVDDIELVIHVDPPAEHKAYTHRSGRTARAGHAGDVVTLVLPEQRRDTADLLRKAAIKVTPQRVTADSPAVAALVGEVAAYVKPAPRTEQPQQQRQSQGGRSQGGRSQGGRSEGGRSQGGRSEGGRSQGGRSSSSDGGRSQGGSRSYASSSSSDTSRSSDGQRSRGRDDRDGASTAPVRGNRGSRSNDAASAGGARQEHSGRPAASGRSHAPQGSGRSGGIQVGGLVRGSGSGAGAGGARRSAPRRAQG